MKNDTLEHSGPHAGLRQSVLKQTVRLGMALNVVMSLSLLNGCAMVNDLGMRAVSSKVDAYVVVNGELLTGKVLLVPDRTGRAMFEGGTGTIKSCMGGMRYTASNGGNLDLRCDNGAEVQIQATFLSETRGFGYGINGGGSGSGSGSAGGGGGQVSLAFGLSAQEAASYLRPPAGKKLVEDFKSGLLELQP